MTTQILRLDRADTIWTCLGVILLFGASQISIPLQPVPVTLQTVGVMLIGLLFSRRSALSAVALYLALGACGAPMFSGFSGGTSVFLRPTAGYLVGFFFAAWAMTYFKRRDLVGIFLNCAMGTSIIFAFGVAWLSLTFGFHQAIIVGVIPFVIPGLAKAGALTMAVRYLTPKQK